ncbi:hypothetical protein AAFC00_004250 [Neodothiora populina]
MSAGLNTTQEYQLRTELKPSQPGKEKYDNLSLGTTHTGAALNDAVLYPSTSDPIKGFTNATNIALPDGGFYQHQEFDLGGDFPWGLSVQPANSYSAWAPVRINVGQGDAAFYLNETGLQYSAPTTFGGWIVCDWWHGVPQLFAKLSHFDLELPSSCVDVYLKPTYI